MPRACLYRGSLILLVACWTGPVAQAPTQADEAAREKRVDKPVDLAIEYRRTPCFGPCPIYQVAIKPAGTLVYFGRDNVAVPGQQQKHLTRRQMLELEKMVEHTHFFSLDDQGNAPADDSCRKPGGGTCTFSFSFSFCTDTSHTVITVSQPKRGGSHTIDDAHCTDGRAAEPLERALDAYVRAWVGQ